MVKNTSISQYTTRTGQKTGRLKYWLQEQANAIATALVAACQNLNSGNLLTNGLNSWSFLVGREDAWPAGTPSSMSVSDSSDGSNLGEMKAKNRLRR